MGDDASGRPAGRERTARDEVEHDGTDRDGTGRDGTGREDAVGSTAADGARPEGSSEPSSKPRVEPDRVPPGPPRPLVERLGMAAIAVVLAAVFAVMALAAFNGGEPFLGVMAGAGSLMTLWVGGLTLRRG